MKKEAGESKPWTDDTILHSYRFCNVRRMDDKVSRWLLENWYQPYFNHPNMLAACALARFFNLPSSLEKITDQVLGGYPSKTKVKKSLKELKLSQPVFNGAYIVCGLPNQDKIDSVLDEYIPSLASVEVITTSMEETWKAIKQCRGLGSFTSGQVVADLRWAVEGTWEDRNTWAPMGPGSKRGMNRLHSRLLKAKLSQTQFLNELLEMKVRAVDELTDVDTNRLEAIDWQNCLCEFDKYERTLLDSRKPKQLYKGI